MAYQLYGVGGEGGVEPAQGVQELNGLPHLQFGIEHFDIFLVPDFGMFRPV